MKSFYLESCQKRNSGLAASSKAGDLSINFSGIYGEVEKKKGEGIDHSEQSIYNYKLIVTLTITCLESERITES